MCALSAGWTGSCQPDEGEVSAVHISHPAATHRQKRTTCLCVALRTTAKEVFFMKRLKQLFKDSFRELKDTRKMAMAAMFVAIAVVLGFYRLQLTEFIRIGVDFLPKEMAAMLLGPSVGCVVAAFTDIISYALKPIGAFFPGLTFSAMLASTIYGTILYKKPVCLKRVILANGLVTVFVNLLLNTYWMSILYGNAYMVLFPTRAVKQLIMFPIEVILFYSVAKMFERANIFAIVRTKNI